MSHYKPYPAYKDSGVEWLGRVPEHWTIGPYKATIQIENGADYKEVEADDGYPVIGSGGPFAFSSKLMYDGESVLLGRKGTIDKPLYVNGAFWAVDTMYWSIIKPGAHGRFAYYIATTIPFDMYSTNTALPSMTKSVLGSHVVAFPGFEEQEAIADHLDRETARIDSLIEKKTRFIELLREKRQALITHVVTKGLDPSVKMKDSGVEWLGEVPQHWTVSRLGHFASVENGSTPSRENPDFWENGTVPWLGSGEVNQVQVTEATELITELALRTCSLRLLPKETVVIGMVGQGKTRGLAAILKIDAAINQNLAAICSGPRLKPMFMLFFFGAAYTWIRGSGRGSNQAALNCELLSEIRLALPPMDEQEEIVRHLVTNGERIDALIERTERSIKFLKERRSALITAAVTGQIDLREAV